MHMVIIMGLALSLDQHREQMHMVIIMGLTLSLDQHRQQMPW